VDVTGSYHQWPAARDCAAVLVRPDFCVYGCARDVGSAQALAADLLADIGPAVTRRAQAATVDAASRVVPA
jgi:hypothetical protein